MPTHASCLPVYTPKDIAQAESYTIKTLGLDASTLMETAGQSAFALFQGLEEQGRLLVLAGPGNNGGDALVFARYALLSGIEMDIVLVHPKGCGKETQKQIDILQTLGASLHTVDSQQTWTAFLENASSSWTWVIDGLFGVGLDRPLEGVCKDVVCFINTLQDQSDVSVFGLDVPSGLDAGSGVIQGSVLSSDILASFAFLKTGFFQNDGPACCGDVFLIPLSIASPTPPQHPTYLLQDVRVKTPDNVDHKGDRGHACIFAGSKAYSGAAVLSSLACQKSNAGLTTLALEETCHDLIKQQLVDVMSFALAKDSNALESQVQAVLQGKTAILLGPGLPPGTWTEELLNSVLQHASVPVVLDATALEFAMPCLQKHKPKDVPIVLTPHPKEMARMVDQSVKEVQSDRLNVAIDFAKQHHVWLVLKGAHTVIASPQGQAWINPTGDQTLSVGGSGDVLAGMLTSFLAQGVDPVQAICQSVWFHGQLGEVRGKDTQGRAILASELLPAIEEFFHA